jgi:hypothetical protein
MRKTFIASGLVTTVTNLLLHSAVYFLFLKGFYRSHPAGSEEFVGQLHRGPDGLIGWAMAVTSLAMGFLIAIIMKWSGAATFVSGLKRGFILGFLFWASVNFGLYATSNYFSQASVFVDTVSSAVIMTISAAVAAWMLGRGHSA